MATNTSAGTKSATPPDLTNATALSAINRLAGQLARTVETCQAMQADLERLRAWHGRATGGNGGANAARPAKKATAGSAN